MKKYIFVVFCAFSLFLLVGCGKSNEVKCTKSVKEGGMKASVEVVASLDKNDKITKVSMTYDFSDKDTAKTFCDVFKADSKSKDSVVCDGSKITFKDLDSLEADEDEDSEKVAGKSKDEFIKAAKEDGFTCK